MDIEQLKIILEAMGAAGDGALMFGLLWLSKGIIITMLWLGFMMYIFKFKISPFFFNLSLLDTIKDFMGIRGDITAGDSERILNSIKFADDILVSAGLHHPSTAQREQMLKVMREAYTSE
jgi:hypothetical protein